MKRLFIAEKPSVAQQFARALSVGGSRQDGYIEDKDNIVTWCVGHLVTMSYPDAYDENLKKWSFDTIPFIPEDYKYEIIPAVSKQFKTVKKLLTRDDVGTIYVCTDSGREGEYIYRLVDMMARVSPDKERRRVWIDSQTDEEILRGIREAKPLSEYDNLSDAAFLRAQEDYLMGINFSRALSLKYAYTVKNYLGLDRCVIAVGRVMTCVLGMITLREREIRDFVPTPFYRVLAKVKARGSSGSGENDSFEAEWKAVPGTKYYGTPALYKENGFREKKDAEELVKYLEAGDHMMKVEKVERKTEKKNPPLLYNLAELQNDCSRYFKISPSDTLETVQELYEKKLVTYPRTDARVMSTAVAKEIDKNLSGLCSYGPVAPYASAIVKGEGFRNIAKSKYVNDKQITDHYAIIPTGQGIGALQSLGSSKGISGDIKRSVYDLIARRFISIFLSPAEYKRTSVTFDRSGEKLFASLKVLDKEGYLKVAYKPAKAESGKNASEEAAGGRMSNEARDYIAGLKKGDEVCADSFFIKEGETSAPKRYTSGTLILAMENAGQLIEDEELREQIKGSGIGTSATRDAIITKLVSNKYIALNKKTQVVMPTFLGEIIYDCVKYSVPGLLRADLTASWEKGLSGVADGTIPRAEYTEKMNAYVKKNTELVKGIRNYSSMTQVFDKTRPFYSKKKA